MEKMKKLRLYYLFSAVMLFLFSGTFLIMPVANRISQRDARIFLVVVGVLFWVSGISGYALAFLAYRMERRMGRKEEIRKRRNIFSASWVMVFLDIVFAGGVLVLFILSKRRFMQEYGAYVILFVSVMAFNMRLLVGSRFGRGIKYHGSSKGKKSLAEKDPDIAVREDKKKDVRKKEAYYE